MWRFVLKKRASELVTSIIRRNRPHSARELYERYADALIPVFTIDVDGDEHIGSAFHVGDGVFVTARHVAENATRCFTIVNKRDLEQNNRESLESSGLEGIQQDIALLPHPDATMDVAIFKITALATLPSIPLGSHLDDWILDDDFVLNNVLVLGFPPIPLSDRPVLVAAAGQINAVVGLINVRHVHFIISVTPRGGFSGGVVISEWDFAWGVITTSLISNNKPEELGYLTVLTVEPILECLGAHRLMPKAIGKIWDGLFTSERRYYHVPGTAGARCFVEVDFDGHRARLRFGLHDEGIAKKAIAAVRKLEPHIVFTYSIERYRMHNFVLKNSGIAKEAALEAARDATEEVLRAEGIVEQDRSHKLTLDDGL
jgi:hypothetical protein